MQSANLLIKTTHSDEENIHKHLYTNKQDIRSQYLAKGNLDMQVEGTTFVWYLLSYPSPNECTHVGRSFGTACWPQVSYHVDLYNMYNMIKADCDFAQIQFGTQLIEK